MPLSGVTRTHSLGVLSKFSVLSLFLISCRKEQSRSSARDCRRTQKLSRQSSRERAVHLEAAWRQSVDRDERKRQARLITCHASYATTCREIKERRLRTRLAVQFLGVRPALSLAASQAVAGVQLLEQELVRPPAP